MCGLIYMEDFRGRPVNNGILNQYEKQKLRGSEGFGLYDGKMNQVVRATKENKILRWLRKFDSPLIMFHHRYPTSTKNVKRAAHPLSTKGYFGDTQYILVHNGIIRNAEDLFTKHQELGIDYHTFLEDLTFNDSESLLWDFALFMEGKQERMQSVGDMAFICVKLEKGKRKKLYFYRNLGRPLNMLRSREGLMLSSEGVGEPIKIDTLHTWAYGNHHLYTQELIVPEYVAKTYHWTKTVPYADPLNDYYDGWEPHSAYTPGSYAATHANRDPVDDEEAYDRWMNGTDIPEKRTMNWLRDVLKDRFLKYYNADGTPRSWQEDESLLIPHGGKVLDYERSEGGLFVPKQTELVHIERQYKGPSDQEIDNTVTAYLSGAQGHFDGAHWAMESDYLLLEDKPQTETVIREKLLIDLALQRLDANDEYVNETSVSSEWRALWAQQALAN